MARNFSRRWRRTVVAVEAGELAERLRDGLAGRGDGGRRVAVRAADRLGDDRVDDAEPHQVLRR